MPSKAPIFAPTEVPSYLSSVAPSEVPAPADPPTHALPSAVPSDTAASEQVARDVLRALTNQATTAYHTSAIWSEFVKQCRDSRGDLHPDVRDLPHRASHVLIQLRRQGATVGMKTPPWNHQQKQDAIKRGSHQSADQHKGFLCEEFINLIRKGQWVLLPDDLVLHEPNLRLSPLGVVPQRDRRPRTICDYSFFLVNLDTIPLAPAEYMQFGRALWRILTTIHKADPQLGPVFLSKVDIADGFYQIQVNASDVPKLGVVVPTEPDQPQLIGSPLVGPVLGASSFLRSLPGFFRSTLSPTF
jgi:hypothetical protein